MYGVRASQIEEIERAYHPCHTAGFDRAATQTASLGLQKATTDPTKEVFKNMNAKELIFSVPTRELATRHIAQLREMPDTQISDSNLETAIANMSAFIEKLAGIEPIETNHILLGIRYMMDGEESLSASLFRKDELLSDFDLDSEIGALSGTDGLSDDELDRLSHLQSNPQSYAYDLSPWAEILGYEVDKRNIAAIGALDLAEVILWEMTFCGYSEEKVAEERAELDRRFEEVEEMLKKPKEEQEKYFIPAEKLWADFGIPKPTPEEAETYRRICHEVLYNNLQTWRAIRDYKMDRGKARSVRGGMKAGPDC